MWLATVIGNQKVPPPQNISCNWEPKDSYLANVCNKGMESCCIVTARQEAILVAILKPNQPNNDNIIVALYS